LACSPAKTHTTPAIKDGSPVLTLALTAGAQAGLRIPCHRVVTLVGRREGCKVHLPDQRIAPVHVAFINDGSKVSAIDLLTSSGTMLNDLKLEYETLNHGDVIELASWSFEAQIKRSPNYGNSDEHAIDLDQSPQVVTLEHLTSGRVLQPNRDVCIIGRRAGADIHLDDNRVSRSHALLMTYYGHPAIVDLLTSNGTFVNEEPVTFRKLQDGDVLGIGDSEFRVRLIASEIVPKAKLNGNGVIKKPKLVANTGDFPGDQIDIAATEGSQRWRIAEQTKKVARG